MSRKYDIINNEEDRIEEGKHIKKVLKNCKYPDWAVQKVEKELAEKKQGVVKPKPTSANEQKAKPGKPQSLPYVQGITERIQRTMRKHGIQSTVRPHMTLRRLLVHPKDKIEDEKKCGLVYKIPCHNCHQVYIGETGRTLGVRIKEHRTESDSKSAPIKTRRRSTTDTESDLKSAVAEHARDHNHVIDWDSVKILERKTERSMRLVREACQVRMLNDGVSMNKDDGGYDLLHIWNPLLRSTVSTTKRSAQAQPGQRLAHQPCS